MEVKMRKLTVVGLLFLVTIKTYALDIDYNWSWGQFGFSYSNVNNKTNLDFNALECSWIETFTGFGIGFKLFDSHFDLFDKDENISNYYIVLFPVEFQWTPFAYKTNDNGYINIGIYDRFGFGWGWDSIPADRYQNIIGLRLILSSIAMGRTKIKDAKSYSWNKALFFEYNTSSNNFRIGFKMDYGILFMTSFMAVMYNNWGSSSK
jgi:hypothetical protein